MAQIFDITNATVFPPKFSLCALTSEPVASRMVGWALSGAQEMHSTTCSCSRSSALHSFVATTQTRTVWSLELLAIRVPSWLGRTIRTHSLWPVNVFTQYLLSISNKHRFNHIFLCQEHFRYYISASLSHKFASHIWLLQLWEQNVDLLLVQTFAQVLFSWSNNTVIERPVLLKEAMVRHIDLKPTTCFSSPGL